MKVSNEQIASVLAHHGALTPESAVVDAAVIRVADKDLVESVVEKVKATPDREDRIAELKAKLDAGQNNPSGDDIADAMIRRAIADRIRRTQSTGAPPVRMPEVSGLAVARRLRSCDSQRRPPTVEYRRLASGASRRDSPQPSEDR